STIDPGIWARWQNAISCFNQSNSDYERSSYQTEWVLLCSAFERILEAKSDAEDVADKFAELFEPAKSLLVGTSKRQSARWKNSGSRMRYEWMREFYHIR